MLNSKVFTLLSISALSFIIYGILKDRPKVLDVKNDVQKIRSQIAQLKESNQKLGEFAEYFRSQAYQEKEARLKLNLKKADEEVVIVKRQEIGDREQVTSTNEKINKSNFFKKIGEWINKILSREL